MHSWTIKYKNILLITLNLIIIIKHPENMETQVLTIHVTLENLNNT